MDQHLVAPDEVRDPKVEPAAFVRDKLRPARDLALDEGDYLTALVVEAARPRSAVEPLALDVLQQIDDGRRPRVAGTTNCVTDANPDAGRVAVGHAARRDQVDLLLGHRVRGPDSLIAGFLAEPSDHDLSHYLRRDEQLSRSRVGDTLPGDRCWLGAGTSAIWWCARTAVSSAEELLNGVHDGARTRQRPALELLIEAGIPGVPTSSRRQR